jgi:hypothetical protein
MGSGECPPEPMPSRSLRGAAPRARATTPTCTSRTGVSPGRTLVQGRRQLVAVPRRREWRLDVSGKELIELRIDKAGSCNGCR